MNILLKLVLLTSLSVAFIALDCICADPVRSQASEHNTTLDHDGIVPGVLAKERSALLKQIVAAKDKGIGVKPYVDAFNKIELAVTAAESAAIIESKLASLSQALDQQLKQAQARGTWNFTTDFHSTTPHKLLMWKISGGKSVAYLLGSVHVLRPSFYPLPDDAEQAFDKSHLLVVEADLTKQVSQSTQQLITEHGLYSDGSSLMDHISEKTRKAMLAYLANSHQPLDSFSQMKPWLVSINIVTSMLRQQGFLPQWGIDLHFMNEALAHGKPIDELESIELQIKLFSGFSETMQDKMLFSALNDVNQLNRVISAMLHAWQTGNMHEMEQLITQDERQHPELKPVQDILLYHRNVIMANKIADYLQSSNTSFTVIGFAHMIGNRGVIKLLKDKGFTVEQVVGK